MPLVSILSVPSGASCGGALWDSAACDGGKRERQARGEKWEPSRTRQAAKFGTLVKHDPKDLKDTENQCALHLCSTDRLHAAHTWQGSKGA